MASKKFWKEKAREHAADAVIESEAVTRQAETIRDLSQALAEAMVIMLPVMEGSITKKVASAKASEWYSKFHYLVTDDEDEEGDDEEQPVRTKQMVPPDPDAYDESDDLTLYGVPVRVSVNHDDGYYDLVRRDNNMPANGTDDPVPADQLVWNGRWSENSRADKEPESRANVHYHAVMTRLVTVDNNGHITGLFDPATGQSSELVFANSMLVKND